VPDRYEEVEYWLIKSATGLTESFRVRLEIGEKVDIQASPIDGSLLGLSVKFMTGDDKNEMAGRRFFPMQNIFHFDIAKSKDPVYKEGESPAELELKRRKQLHMEAIQRKAAKLAEGLDDED
jgi:hypothetical protein